MAESILKGKHILVVDDEEDVIETIKDILDMARIDTATDYEGASRKLRDGRYDLAILDIMGVNGIKLLDEAVEKGIPAVMLTAHAITPDVLIQSIRKGAISFLPKETLAELDRLLESLLESFQGGTPPWKLLFEKLGGYFDERFGPQWKEKDREFWSEFSRTYNIGKGVQARLAHDPALAGKGI
ncbi:response regulator [Desulfatirhabdium butyrativorans]|uniref:response regulator n=1 Tax=Desulfatirhabdium butyrativorans TaxID=340467 RepID=UPI0004102D1A|nr:response regulator [Desulfatirhabdium butyrativorans]